MPLHCGQSIKESGDTPSLLTLNVCFKGAAATLAQGDITFVPQITPEVIGFISNERFQTSEPEILSSIITFQLEKPPRV